MSRTRTFIAVGLSKAIRDRTVALQKKLARKEQGVKWVEPGNLHATLSFLGEVDDREVPGVCRIVSDQTSAQAAFPMTVEAVGAFPNARTPRILWVGVSQGSEELSRLYRELELSFAGLGYRRENRRYSPHVTLGRVRADQSTEALAAALAGQVGWKGGDTRVQELLIMGSELTSSGPRYTVLGRARLRS